ncbi:MULTISPECIES: hypothetical protein [Sinorhizobium]|uniref:hypothetical protein n=1 Tax=Sinorhizobium TaxID=28105 RepID=UPI0002E21D9F|nr:MULTISPECIES: hypothetical protein [Sinorhizobium]MDE3767577.1 hypothetical protein [Sinorhizobium meliloti]MDE3779793.1 hypothetical protein [Sinorhizobium meliloti]MDE3807418.1 hypothetical protein [Sinorhizobium meliloti]WQO45900.1 hypothetical protein U8C42_02420 [Sinorhizobium medicae]
MTRNSKQTREPQSPALIAWHVTEKGEKKAFWTRIGAAWRHQKGEGLTLQLDLVPVTGGRIVLLPPKEDNNEEGAGA